MPEWLKNVLGFIILLLALAIIALPFVLIIAFPESAEAIADVSAYAIPWLVIFVIIAVFNDGIRAVFFSVERAIDRIKKLSAGSAAAELDSHQTAIPASKTGIADTGVQPLFDAGTSNLFFIRYVYATIYGSQLELLKKLKEGGPQPLTTIVDFYTTFQKRLNNEFEYRFDQWLGYLRDNLLIQDGGGPNTIEATQAGALFVETVSKLDQPRKFLY